MSFPEQSLISRLERLETAVAAIQEHLSLDLKELVPQKPPVEKKPLEAVLSVPRPSATSQDLVIPKAPKPVIPAKPQAEKSQPKPSQPTKPNFVDTLVTNLTDTEFLLNKLGIGLLLFGIIFLFKFSIDQGWITPPVRLAIGYLIGATLMGFSLRLHSTRTHFSQVLAGGAIGAFYITTFAGYFILEILPYSLSIGLMSTTTIAAYSLAVWKKQSALAYIGLLGGLATPFLLPTDEASVAGLLAYSSLVISGAMAIYFTMGWRFLLPVASLGGWLIYLLAYFGSIDTTVFNLTVSENHWPLQLGLIFNLVAFGLLPVIRAVLDLWLSPVNDEAKAGVPWYIHLYAVGTPLAFILFTSFIWSLSDTSWGAIWLGLALLYGFGGFALDQAPHKALGHAFYLVSSILLTGSLSWFFDGETRLLVLAIEAIGLQLLATRWRYPAVSVISHLLFFGLTISVIISLFETTPENAFMNARMLADIIFLAGAVLVSQQFKSPTLQIIYRFMAHALAMLVIGREFTVFSDSQPYHLLVISWTLLAWGVFTIGHFIKNSWLKYQSIIALLVSQLYLIIPDLMLQELVWSHFMFFTIGIQALILAGYTYYQKDNVLEIGSYLYSASLVLWLIFRLDAYPATTAFLNWPSIVHLGTIIVLAVIAWQFAKSWDQIIYAGMAHLLILIWVVVQSQPLSFGDGLISVMWGGYAIALLVGGLVTDEPMLRRLGILTIFLVIAKLFLYDLAELDAIWRILLFIGFGGVLLVVSYFVRALWRGQDVSDDVQEAVEVTI